MRLQLTGIWLYLFTLSSAWGQIINSTANDSVAIQTNTTQPGIDANFLFGYYKQDGNHSAVTGGTGTEELTDRDFRFIINIPLDSVQSLNINAGINYYSSASTDNIDTKVSSASSEDVRSQFYFTYTRLNPKQSSSISIGWGGSVESDYISTSFGAAWSKISKSGNRQFDLSARAYFDNWVLIFPEELRNPSTELPDTDRRRSYSMAITYHQVINTRLHASLSGELVYQRGLLSTPFHRVYFVEQDTAKIEKAALRPIQVSFFALRLTLLPIGRFPGIPVRSCSYYFDNFGIQMPLPPAMETQNQDWSTHSFLFYPFYRFHHQTSADYFAPLQTVIDLSDRYYTSDFDLSQI